MCSEFLCSRQLSKICWGADSRLNIAQSTVSIILKEVTSAINDHMLRQWIHFPTTQQEIQEIVQKYKTIIIYITTIYYYIIFNTLIQKKLIINLKSIHINILKHYKHSKHTF